MELLFLRAHVAHSQCTRCGSFMGKPVVRADDPEQTPIHHACEACWDKAVAGMAALREAAAELRANGVHDRMVQRILLAKVERETC